MKNRLLLLAAGAFALSPASLAAQTAPTTNRPTTTNQVGPTVTTGQPNQSCEDLIAAGTGSFPGHSSDNGTSAFGGSAGDVYAGSQPQNSVNSVSISQYDVACSKQPQ